MPLDRHGTENGLTADAFWSFSLSFYDEPGAADALLALQDEHQFNINLLLLLLYLAREGRGLEEAEHGPGRLDFPVKDVRKRIAAVEAFDIEKNREASRLKRLPKSVGPLVIGPRIGNEYIGHRSLPPSCTLCQRCGAAAMQLHGPHTPP